jgi:hypothetical protein
VDRGTVQRVRRSLIRAGVVTPDMSDEEITDRASHILRAMHTFADAIIPALNETFAKHGDLFRRLAEIADAAEEEGS